MIEFIEKFLEKNAVLMKLTVWPSPKGAVSGK